MDQIYLDSTDPLSDLSVSTNESSLPLRGLSRHQHPPVQPSPLTGRDPFTSHRRASPCRNLEARLTELESENLRLHRLVAELLIKNEQLRK